MGHRNPQGLFVSATGVVWETEHGPKGGDELNVIVAGANYGWPLRTYGTSYGGYTWPYSDEQGSHGDYELPLLSWSPSIGISSLLVVEGNEFPTWKGDLLVASLRANSLYRIRHREGRVTLVEKIVLERNLRDIVEMDDGTIVLLADSESDGWDGDLLILENASGTETLVSGGPSAAIESQEQLLVRYPSLNECATCHSLGEGMAHGIGPNLWGIIGQEIGSAPGYEYSSALSTLTRTWTARRVRDFLTDPGAFAPGSLMPEQRDLTEQAIDEIISSLRALD